MDLVAVFSLNQVEGWFEWGGYFILFGLLFACGLGLPLPEDVPLLLAGYFIAQAKMNPVIAAVWPGWGLSAATACSTASARSTA